MKQSRKEFLKALGILTAGACCGAGFLSLSGCATTKSVSGKYENGKLKVNKDAFLENDAVTVTYMSLDAPILLHKNGKGYKAVLMLCTHKGCELEQSGTVLVCPCHGSEFSLEGAVLNPPAIDRLKEFMVTEEGNFILIQL